MAWTSAARKVRRDTYARNHASGHGDKGKRLVVPADIVVLDRDPAPCFRCGEREGCRHRSVFGW